MYKKVKKKQTNKQTNKQTYKQKTPPPQPASPTHNYKKKLGPQKLHCEKTSREREREGVGDILNHLLLRINQAEN